MDRRKFFGMLGGTAVAVPVTQLQALAPEVSAIEIRPASNYVLLFKIPSPITGTLHAVLLRQLEEFIDRRGLRNVSPMIVDSSADVEFFKLDPS